EQAQVGRVHVPLCRADVPQLPRGRPGPSRIDAAPGVGAERPAAPRQQRGGRRQSAHVSRHPSATPPRRTGEVAMRFADSSPNARPRRASNPGSFPNDGAHQVNVTLSFRGAPAGPRDRSASAAGPRRARSGHGAMVLRASAVLLLAIASLSVTGCGYHWAGDPSGAEPGYGWKGLYREDVSTVAVPIFTNRTFYRGVEFDLSKAVINQLESRTPYKVAPSERAD